ncbi:hypothetical protein KAW38_04855 [Candidatus Micrarchaeota archaeon]|nr:hypothetical protein [Candidatus Micrarchaeota archaeon]
MFNQKLDSAFRSTCRTLFKQELGSLEEFKTYLTSTAEPITKRTSSISGKDIYLYYSEYPKEGRFISYAELERLKKPTLDINAIKDIDSLLDCIKDTFFYCGDKNLGRCIEVNASDGSMDAGFVFESNAIYDSQYAAYSNILLSSKFIFGSTYSAFTNSIIRGYHNYRSTRLFQTGYSNSSSDLYFSWHMGNCRECLFSFNQKNKQHMIGNIELQREKYLSLKEKLLEEVAEIMQKKKSFPTIFKIAKGVQP